MDNKFEEETEFGGGSLSGHTKRIIHFSSGETLEEEEEREEEEVPTNGEAFTGAAEKGKFSWINFVILVGRMSLRTCDFLGEKLSGLLGLNAAKYQYAIDQYHREHKIKSSPDTEEGLAEGGAERTHLSSRERKEYGATQSPRTPSCFDQKAEGQNQGLHNQGYQEDIDNFKLSLY
ncbi:protein FAM177A1 [Lampris incognitus]|uniref:protein FAM177A1 n=1 Tax=Lampris incognitus TaxID=2546036 RepID=UPI0024B4D4AA|nr:protein FAM177A1 [Lampris incognitus]